MVYKVSCKTKSAPTTAPYFEMFVNAFSEPDAKKRAMENLDTRIYETVAAFELRETDKIVKGTLSY